LGFTCVDCGLHHPMQLTDQDSKPLRALKQKHLQCGCQSMRLLLREDYAGVEDAKRRIEKAENPYDLQKAQQDLVVAEKRITGQVNPLCTLCYAERKAKKEDL